MLISIDGPDGTGKSTLCKNLVSKLENLGYSAIYTCEPTNSPKGLVLRTHLQKGDLDKDSMLQLFLEDRKEHLEDFILPMSKKGYIVICDRYKYSTVCYQHIQGFPLDYLVHANDFAASPDLAIILTLDKDEIISRINGRGLARDIFEQDALICKAIEIYESMQQLFPNENIIYSNFLGTSQQLLDEIFELTMPYILKQLNFEHPQTNDLPR